jgi:hypothetical protein
VAVGNDARMADRSSNRTSSRHERMVFRLLLVPHVNCRCCSCSSCSCGEMGDPVFGLRRGSDSPPEFAKGVMDLHASDIRGRRERFIDAWQPRIGQEASRSRLRYRSMVWLVGASGVVYVPCLVISLTVDSDWGWLFAVATVSGLGVNIATLAMMGSVIRRARREANAFLGLPAAAVLPDITDLARFDRWNARHAAATTGNDPGDSDD